jgi:hypothetical protein
MTSTITCMHCQTKKENYDSFTQVTLPLQTADYINFEYKLVDPSPKVPSFKKHGQVRRDTVSIQSLLE